MSMPEWSVVILDDLVEESYSSKTIDYLFRVLSSKRKLHVILMSQRYYHTGLEFKNCSSTTLTFLIIQLNSNQVVMPFQYETAQIIKFS